MKKIIFLIGFFTVVHTTILTQIIDNSKGEVTHANIHFNQEYIQRNNIKSITGKIQVKPQFKPMIDEGLNCYYEFDQKGRIITFYTTQKNIQTNTIDTAIVYYKYTNSLLTEKWESEYGGFTIIKYEYDSKGNITQENHYRALTDSLNQYTNFSPKDEKYVTSKYYESSKINDSTFKKTYLNNIKKSFKTETEYYSGRFLIERETVFHLSQKRITFNVEFNELGYTALSKYSNNIQSKENKYFHYNYDAEGNITAASFYDSEEEKYVTEFLYTPEFLLKATLQKNIASKLVTITKFEYKYF